VTMMMASARTKTVLLSVKQNFQQMTAVRSSSSSLLSLCNSSSSRKSLSFKPSSTRLLSSTSSTTTNGGAATTTATTTLERYGLGGQHWKQFDPSAYQNLIYGALTHVPYPVNYYEIAGPDGGEIALVGSIQSALEKIEQQQDGILKEDLLPSTITITTRIGYRSPTSVTTSTGDSNNEQQQSSLSSPVMVPLPGDVVLSSSTEGGGEKEESSFNPKSSTYNLPSHVAHNIDPQYVIDTVKSSTLWELQQESILKDRLRFVFLLHNPEAQIVELLRDQPNANHNDRQEFLRTRLTPAMEALQEFCSSSSSSSSSTDISAVSSSISSFGIVSNGLGIPPSNNHPMHLSADLVIESCRSYDKFSTVHLPANLLETHGWDVAKSIKSSSKDVEVCAIRPLSAYPDLGTGDSYPFRLVDYSLPSLEQYENEQTAVSSKPEIKAKYTNEMNGIPVVYQMALQAAMSHFDAEPLLEAKLERELTTDERETLDGCKLVQSMIHDLDAQLQDIRSFAKHEDELYGKIIPLLYDTFEAMDDQTSDVLQAYFAAYAVAVRYAIANKTRELLKNGEDRSTKGNKTSTVTYSDIPQHMTLQEYALRRMLSKTGDSSDGNEDESLGCFDRIIIGSSTSQDFEHQTHLMELIQSEDGDPMDGIRHQLEVEKEEDEQQKSNKKDRNSVSLGPDQNIV